MAINIASRLANQGYKTLLIDADKQESSSTWASLREGTLFQVVSLACENMGKDALSLAADYQLKDSSKQKYINLHRNFAIL